ncbi:MAG: acetate kinase [Clostridia bacterium]|nr:acetate kinase [Clostridia bacterium]
MKILVINAGSSSMKYQLMDMDGEVVLAKGNCERIGNGGHLEHKAHGQQFDTDIPMPDHTVAFEVLKKALTEGTGKVIDDLSEITAIGHRVVQGGSSFTASCLIDDTVVEKVKQYIPLAPIHNPACLRGIEAATAAFGKDIPQVAVFDTAFHQTMPEKAYMYGLPYEYYEKYGIRRYGFHGTSHRFVSKRCFELLGKPDGKGTRVITCHIGSGASIAAIKDGEVVDTSMGMTPLDGFMMSTRCGAVDPSAVTFLMEKEGLSPAEMDNIMNKKSGMASLSGKSSDDRDVDAAIVAGDKRAKMAWDVRSYQIAKTIGGYLMALGGADAIVLTAGSGENQYRLRKDILDYLAWLGVTIDDEAAHVRRQEIEISGKDSAIRVFVIPTDEELVIARDTKEIVSAM